METEALPVEQAAQPTPEVEVEPLEADVEIVNEVAKLWAKVQEVEGKLGEVPSLSEEISKVKSEVVELKVEVEKKGEEIAKLVKSFDVYKKIAEWIGSWKCTKCKFYDKGVCKAWKLAEAVAKELKECLGDEAVVVVDGVPRFRVDKVPIVGAICPLFKAKS